MNTTVQSGLRAAFLLCLPLLLLAVVVLAVTTPAAAASGGMALGAVTGAQTLEAQPGHWEPRDVSDKLTLMDIASDVPFDQFMRRLPKRRKAVKNIKVSYYRRDAALPRLDVTTAQTAAVTAGNTSTLSVANAALWKPNDTIDLIDSPTAVQLYVLSTDVGAGTITVVGLPSGSGMSDDVKVADTTAAVPLIADATRIGRLAATKSTGDAPSEARHNQSVEGFNFCELIDCVVEADEDAFRTENYTMDPEYRIRRREALETMRRDANLKRLFGKRSISLKNGKFVYTQDGAREHAAETFNFSDGSLTESQLIDLGYLAGGNTASRTRVILGGPVLTKNFDKAMLANLQHGPDRVIAGVEVSQVKTRRTKLYIALDPAFEEMGLDNEGVCLDFDSMRNAEFRPLEITPLKHKEAGTADKRGEWFQERTCTEFHNTSGIVWLRAT